MPSRGLSPPQATDTGAFSKEDSNSPWGGKKLHLIPPASGSQPQASFNNFLITQLITMFKNMFEDKNTAEEAFKKKIK